MFTFIQAQTQYPADALYLPANSPFFQQMQKALLLSLKQEALISQTEYEQCLQLMKGKKE